MERIKYKPFRITRIFKSFGLDRQKFTTAIFNLNKNFKDYRTLKKQKGNNEDFYFGSYYPQFSDLKDSSGTMKGHYFHQDLYVAQKIYENKPRQHLDIGSRTDGFVAHVAVFREIEIIDIREQISKVKNIKFRKADLMQLPKDIVNSYDSVSSLHAIEHFGLGRYGDPIDYFGYQKAIDNIKHILKNNGKLYFSVPIGSQRIEFNAHRVFDVKYLINLFTDDYHIDSFSYVDDAGDFHPNVELNEEDVVKNYGCVFGCGILEMTKL